jgi:nitroreductase
MPDAFAFLAARRSAPGKLLRAPAPDRHALTGILRAALRVPDHGKLEPWRLIALGRTELARLADLAETRARALGGDAERIAKGRGLYDTAPLAVAVIASPKPSEKIPEVEQLLSAGAVAFGILNAATAAGWGASWLTGWPAHDPVFAAEAFGCTGAERVAGLVVIGTKPDPLPPDRPRPDPDAKTEWRLG